MSGGDHYFSRFPDAKLKIFTVSESLRKHLYLFKTVTGIFSYNKLDLGTKILIEHMTIPSEPSYLLDLGCGYGPIGIVLGYESPESIIYMIDINSRAVWCARQNVKLNIYNYKKRIFTINGNYFDPIKFKGINFNGIYMNPPMRQGQTEFLKLFEDVDNLLKKNGFFEFVIKRKMGAEAILLKLKKKFPDKNLEIICKRSGYWVIHLQKL